MALPLIRLKNEDGTYADILGIKGDKGDPGICIEKSGFFAFEGDADGNLYVVVDDDDTPPTFEVADNGDIFIDIGGTTE